MISPIGFRSGFFYLFFFIFSLVFSCNISILVVRKRLRLVYPQTTCIVDSNSILSPRFLGLFFVITLDYFLSTPSTTWKLIRKFYNDSIYYLNVLLWLLYLKFMTRWIQKNFEKMMCFISMKVMVSFIGGGGLRQIEK